MDGELHQVVRMIQFVPTFDDVEDDGDEDEDDGSDGSEEEEVPGYQAIEFIVLKLEESDGSRKWVEVKSIGDNALFLGYNTSFSLSSLAASEIVFTSPMIKYHSTGDLNVWIELLPCTT
ncbi:hypothetical protein AQUCO_01600375v1 [Aquilegia coerulea]|uniref:KIB1-4 beta-propeller domain-containing protein n=1 Tax=Aquilegia coerulea TaxID=218851 RepID=A0A2G5DRA8_AQUCA|nr:hypothetical protein AQUCO_01600375v1 [Aquilegia coerulea]